MKKLFKQIPTMKSKPLSQDKKYQLPLTYIVSAWYLTHLATYTSSKGIIKKNSWCCLGSAQIKCIYLIFIYHLLWPFTSFVGVGVK